jgi:RimJ/RimL family protein N-acetyltransferase
LAYSSFLRFLFDELGMNKVSLEVLEHNIRAQRLYRKLGFTVEGIKRQEVWRYGRYLDSQLMSMLKSEYVAPRVSAER